MLIIIFKQKIISTNCYDTSLIVESLLIGLELDFMQNMFLTQFQTNKYEVNTNRYVINKSRLFFYVT